MHIHNDVHWFVRSMTNYEQNFNDLGKLPRNTIVSYLDSALLHGRSLLEFFGHTPPGKHNHVRACHYVKGDCPDSRSDCDLEWKPAMNQYLMHLTSDRDAQVAKPIDVVAHKEHWRLPELWQHLESEFLFLAHDSSSDLTRAFYSDLISSQVPEWQLQD